MSSHYKSYLTTLTPLRGIAAIIIVIYHSNMMLMPFLPPNHTQFLMDSWLWVDFFFILSGFIMCYAYSSYFDDSVKTTMYKKYMAARFARIYPLHFVTTLWMFFCSIILVHITGHTDVIVNPKALPAALLLIQSMHVSFKAPPLNTPSWSLSTEWWVYTIFPFFVPLFTRIKNIRKIIAIVGIAVFYIFLRYEIGPITYSHSNPTLAMTTDFGFFRCLAGFLTGMLFFTFYEQRVAYNFIKHDWFFVLTFFSLLAAMCFGVMDIIIVAFFPFVLIAAAYNKTSVKWVLDTRILQRLGDWSFSIYLIHVPIIYTIITASAIKNRSIINNAVKRAHITLVQAQVQTPNYLMGFFKCIILLTSTILLSALFYRFLEIPARNYFNRVFKTNHRKITPETLRV